MTASNRTAIPNGVGQSKALNRADEADDLLSSIKDLVIEFIRAADEDASIRKDGHGLQQPGGGPRTTLLEKHSPHKLQQLMDATTAIPTGAGRGRSGAMEVVQDILKYSVNTWDQGFLDKLYASTTPIGLAAELLLSALNTNVHIYQVSPALTIVEKRVGKAIAHMFGLNGAHSGAITQPGGSAANQSSIVIARNCLFPETKTEGNGSHRFVLFTSAHGHYSVEKAAQMFGLGSNAVRPVAVDERGRMLPKELDAAILRAKDAGETPFYVNATAGTTVLGSVDPLEAIAEICAKHRLWMHVDGSWGGSMVFSAAQKHKLQGVERADSVAFCPHKMMGVPLTCSFLVGKDLRDFHKGMTLPAGYLFHNDGDDDEQENGTKGASAPSHLNGSSSKQQEEFWDLADLTPQCGRRGDSLKMALTWIYYGTDGLAAHIDHGFEMSAYLASLVADNSRLALVSENPPPCLQVCFYYNKHTVDAQEKKETAEEARTKNNRTTEAIAKGLIPKGFMVDYAPGEEGKFLRVVVNGQTRKETLDGLIKAVDEIGQGLKL